MDGSKGDILLRNADCAEEFEISRSENAGPGTVMIVNENSLLKQSYRAYDKRVAAVISGAGDYKSGIVLDKKMSSKNSGSSRLPIPLLGKVYCKVDAR